MKLRAIASSGNGVAGNHRANQPSYFSHVYNRFASRFYYDECIADFRNSASFLEPEDANDLRVPDHTHTPSDIHLLKMRPA